MGAEADLGLERRANKDDSRLPRRSLDDGIVHEDDNPAGPVVTVVEARGTLVLVLHLSAVEVPAGSVGLEDEEEDASFFVRFLLLLLCCLRLGKLNRVGDPMVQNCNLILPLNTT